MQRHRMLRAKVALALYGAYGRVPKEEEINYVYHQFSRVLRGAILRTLLLRWQHKRGGQIALFEREGSPC